jgi:hypothetical protein
MTTWVTTAETGEVWGRWTTTAATCATWGDPEFATTTVTTTTWRAWTAGTTTTASAGRATDTTVAWRCWVEDSAGRRREVPVSGWKFPKAPELTPEEVAAREEARKKAEEERELRAAEAKKKEDEADRRAEELLLAHLSAEQRQEYTKDKSFSVRCARGRRYRVHRAWGGHVTRLDEKDRPVERLCLHPRDKVPLPDNQLIAKLLLETDPERLHKIAYASAVPLPAGAD